MLSRWLGRSSALGASNRPVAAIPASVDPNLFPVLAAGKLFEQLDVLGKIDAISSFTGYPGAAFDQLCRPALEAFAEAVQLLPASQAHHHAGPGGMVVHTLEVVEAALRRRKGFLLPQGGVAEDIQRQEHIWTYAIFVAALLHDIGKPIADQKISLSMPDGSSRDWSPLAEPMRKLGATHYRVDFVRVGKNYDLHNQVSMTMYPLIVPAAGRDWLAQNRELMAQLSAWLYGDIYKSGVIGQIVSNADGDSVASNLQLGDKSKLAAATDIPLVEKLLKYLRYLLATGKLPLNRDGAAGWVYQGHIWLLVPRAVDALRLYMSEQGYTGVPTDNERIFDTFQEHGVLVPTPKDKAVWTVIVAGDDYKHKFTAIRFPLGVLYRPRDYPKEMEGTVTPVELLPPLATAAPASTAKPPVAAVPAPEAPKEIWAEAFSAGQEPIAPAEPYVEPAEAAVEDSSPDDLMARLDALSGLCPAPDAPEQAETKIERPVAAMNSPAPPETAPVRVTKPPRTETAPAIIPSNIAPIQVKPDTPPALPGTVAKKKANPESVQLMQWIQAGLQSGEMAYNESGAIVHFVTEGMLLVSPKVFQTFARIVDADADWSALQRKFVKSGWPIRAPDGKFVWSYQIVSGKNEGKGIFLNGFLIDPAPFISQPPPANPYLVLFEGALIDG